MTVVGLDLRGDKALIKALAALEGSVNRRVIKGATLKAMKPVVKSAKDNVRPHDRTGQLRKSIGTKQKKYPSGIMWTAVGPRKGFKIDTEQFGPVNPVNYGHLLEFGNQQHDGKPWLRPAFDSNKGRIQSIMTRELRVGIAKEVLKARQKAGGPR